MLIEMERMRCLAVMVALFAIMLVTSAIRCAGLFKGSRINKPVRIVLVDESRVDNAKVRHIFREFFLKGLVDQGRDEIVIVDLDSINGTALEKASIDYLIAFDVMDFGSWDIERGTERVLVSVKIANHVENIIVDSFIASARNNTLEVVCFETAQKLSSQVVKRATGLRREEERLEAQLNVLPDSL